MTTTTTKHVIAYTDGASSNNHNVQERRGGWAAILVTIFTDSQYVIGVLSKHWKPKQNQVLIAEMKALLAKHTVTFEKVEGHAGVEYNTRADALAVASTQI